MKNNDDIFPLNDCDIVLLVAIKYNFEIPQIISIYLRLNTWKTELILWIIVLLFLSLVKAKYAKISSI